MLNAYTNQEVFMLVPTGSVTEEEELTAFRTIEELNNYLKVYTEDELEDMRVLHGYLTSAKILPRSFSGLFPYIIAENPSDPGLGAIVESDADLSDELAAQIEQVLSKIEETEPGAEYNIDDFFVLYGYELQLQLDPYADMRMQVQEFDVNDVQVDDAKKIAYEVMDLGKKYKKILSNEG